MPFRSGPLALRVGWVRATAIVAAVAVSGCGQQDADRSSSQAREAHSSAEASTGSLATGGPAATPPRREAPARWVLLPARQREALAPLEDDWASLTPDQRQKWVEVALRFPRLSEPERERIQDRMTAWSRLTPAERGRARWAFQEMRPLAGAELDERWRAYRELDEADRQRLAEQARRQSMPVATLRRPETSASPVPKTQVINPPAVAATAKPAGPTIVAAPLGATTGPVGRLVTPPAHQQAGQPKIVASRDFVDTQTLLPRVGPQSVSPGAHTPAAPSSPAAPDANSPPPATAEPAGDPGGETPNPTPAAPTGPPPTAAPAGGPPATAGTSS